MSLKTFPFKPTPTGETMHSRLPRTIAAIIKVGLLGLLVSLASSPLARAQSQITTGVIQGTVSDPNGAVLPGATVEVKNLETNLTRNVTTDDDGRFSFLT